jgi:hypothetical protein
MSHVWQLPAYFHKMPCKIRMEGWITIEQRAKNKSMHFNCLETTKKTKSDIYTLTKTTVKKLPSNIIEICKNESSFNIKSTGYNVFGIFTGKPFTFGNSQVLPQKLFIIS